METKELLAHMDDISSREIEYRNNPLHGLSPFYQYLETIGCKDENSIYFIPQSMLKAGSSSINPNSQPFFWDNINQFSENFVIKKATRFYREPFMYGDFIAFRYVYRGQCHLYTPDRTIVLKANDLIMMNRGFVFSQELGENDHVFTMMINQDFIRQHLLGSGLTSEVFSDLFLDYMSNTDSLQKYIVFHGNDNLHIRTVIEEILCSQFDRRHYYDTLMEYLLKILFMYLADCPNDYDQSNSKSMRRIAGIINYTSENYRTVTLGELEERFGYSAKYISRLFAGATGMSFKEYILNLRLEGFTRNLLNTDRPLDQLMAEEGISNESYFYTQFRQLYQLTPSAYRRTHKNKTL